MTDTEPMSAEDLEYCRDHARRYAARSLSFGHLADDYAAWYVEQVQDLPFDTRLPEHSRLWSQWVTALPEVTS